MINFLHHQLTWHPEVCNRPFTDKTSSLWIMYITESRNTLQSEVSNSLLTQIDVEVKSKMRIKVANQQAERIRNIYSDNLKITLKNFSLARENLLTIVFLKWIKVNFCFLCKTKSSLMRLFLVKDLIQPQALMKYIIPFIN